MIEKINVSKFTKDVSYKNGSILRFVGSHQSIRGYRATDIIMENIIDKEDKNNIIYPMEELTGANFIEVLYTE